MKKKSGPQAAINANPNRTPATNHKSAALRICDQLIRVDNAGRYCLNDLHRAGGGLKKHQPSNWLRLDNTLEFVAEADSSSDVRSLVVINGVGTFATRELILSYAMRISARFHLHVLRVFDAVITATPAMTDLEKLLADPASLRQALLAVNDRLIEQQPKIEAIDRLTAADGAMCITDAAKLLDVRPRVLFDWLTEHRWIYRRCPGTPWLGYEPRIRSGLLETRVTSFRLMGGNEHTTFRTLVTPRGLVKPAELLRVGGDDEE